MGNSYQNPDTNIKIRATFQNKLGPMNERTEQARNVRGEYLHIVNTAAYSQAVEVEQCEAEGRPCRTDTDAPYSGNTGCRQKYATYKLYAISGNNTSAIQHRVLALGCKNFCEANTFLFYLCLTCTWKWTCWLAASKEQVYDSFSLPSACVCFYRSPSTLRAGLQTAASSPVASRGQLPRCEAGTKLALPRFVTTFSSFSRRQRTSAMRRPRWGRQGPGRPSPALPRTDGRGLSDRSYRWTRATRLARRRRQAGRATSCSATYCSRPAHYPAHLTRALLARQPAVGVTLFKQVFDEKCSDVRRDIGTRVFSLEEEQLCSGRQRVIFPRQALNLDNEWVFVVNIDNFTQAVEVEECEGAAVSSSAPGQGSCLYGGAAGNNPLATSCRQVYTQYKLLAVSSDQDSLEVDTFMLPSACACYTHQSFNIQLQL